MELIGMLVAVALMTVGAVRVGNAVSGAGRRAVAAREAAVKRRREARATRRRSGSTSDTTEGGRRRPMPDTEPLPAVVKVASKTAGAWYGTGLYARAGWKGARVGWADGRERVIDWWEQRQKPAQSPPEEGAAPAASEPPRHPSAPTAENPASPQPMPRPTGTGTPSPAPTGRNHLKPVPNPTPPGGNPMAVHTVTGGDVRTIEEALAEARAMAAAAQTELEDAAADAERAKQEARRVARYEASLKTMEFPEAGRALARQMAEAKVQRRQAAERRKAAAEVDKNAADRLVVLLQKHIDLASQAASIGGMAKREAYGVNSPANREGAFRAQAHAAAVRNGASPNITA